MTGDADGLDELLAQMQQLQSELAQAEADTANRSVTGSAGGRAVRIELSGEFSVDSVKIDPAVVAGGDVALLEDLILAALRDGAAQLLELRKQLMGDAVGHALGGLFGGNLPGALPGLEVPAPPDESDE
ncbi:MAG TPA: YbaB/EbfC family nucleoid-associated protein [Acidimicrobiales bacterium]|nr:YbaB/EbfC family nucleoid-associated protein [Acidimicrobiales bacterium]